MSRTVLFNLVAALLAIAPGLHAAEEVRAESFGFDETDATSALQQAIDSKAKKVIIGNPGKPWNVRPIKLASDQALVFEKGAVLQALRGAFQDRNHMLLRGDGVKNVTLRGDGATLRMWKADYQASPYQKSEWRHALAFYACENVTVSGLLIADSGGDGIYLGAGKNGAPCRNVTIRDVQCVNHHRQGISVISAEDLTLDGCTFKDTSGTAPQAGIDFEPNSAKERLKNCLLRNCTFENNHSYGILFALRKLKAESEPLGIRVENCRTVGNLGAVLVAVGNPNGVTGSIAFDRCRFEGSTRSGVDIRNKAQDGVALTFSHCELLHLAGRAPIAINSTAASTETLGGVAFDDCTVELEPEQKPLLFDDTGTVGLKGVTGTLALRRGTDVQRVELSPALLNEWFPGNSERKSYTRFEMKGQPYVPAFLHARRPFPPFDAWQRGDAEFFVWSREGGTLDFTLALKTVGKTAIRPVPVRLISPSEKVTDLPPLTDTKIQRHTEKANEGGFYRIVCSAGPHTVALQSAGDVACLASPRGSFHFVGRAGPLCFLVPKGVAEFGLKIGGGGGTEMVKATIKDAAGVVRASKDNIAQGEPFDFKREDTSRGEIWSIALEHASEGVLEDVQLLLQGVPPFLSASPESIVQPAGADASPPPRFFHLPQLVLIGDSLVASYAKPPPDRPTLTGWGQVLDQYLGEGVGVRNEARSGASSKSFLERGFWQTVVAGPPADYLVMQFGGNDNKPDDRFTDPATTYQDMLRGYIFMARGLGMKPVLVSNAAARTFGEDGHIVTTLDAYVTAMKQVAEKEHVPFVDLHGASKAFFEKLGEKGSAPLNASAEDHSHFSREGALAVAKLVAEGLKKEVPELAEFIKTTP